MIIDPEFYYSLHQARNAVSMVNSDERSIIKLREAIEALTRAVALLSKAKHEYNSQLSTWHGDR